MEQCYCVAVRCRSKHGKVYRYGIPDFDSHRGSKGLAHRCNHVCNPALGNVELVQQEGELGSVAEAGSQPTEQRPKVFIAGPARHRPRRRARVQLLGHCRPT